MKQPTGKYLYVALDIQESDPGFAVVCPAITGLGKSAKIGPSFWQLETELTSVDAFKQINASMMDRRIDSHATLMLLDPSNGEAKWHLRQPMAELIRTYWGYQNNLLISFNLKDGQAGNRKFIERMTQLGVWAPLSKTIWYISSSYKSADAFHFLTGALEAGSGFSMLDGRGNIALWQNGLHNGLRNDRMPTGLGSEKKGKNERRRSVLLPTKTRRLGF
ncbi:MAG: hypothetical protein AB8G77_15925 [Rhodothermales bacterium]